MSTVFVIGAGASIGAKPGGVTSFPSTFGLLKRVREIVCGRESAPSRPDDLSTSVFPNKWRESHLR